MNVIAKLLSVQVGKVAVSGDKSSKEFLTREYTTASCKNPVDGKVQVTKDGIAGDAVADTVHHGGVDKVVFANSFLNYKGWQEFLQADSLPFGALAENLTFDGIDERDVCIGDVHKIGSVILEVSQPRKPCWKISRRWGNKNFTKEIFDTGKTGWYYRVLQEGLFQKGDEVELMSRPEVRVTVQEANEAFKDPDQHGKSVEKLLALEMLADAWSSGLKKRASNKSDDLAYMNVE
ncbi:MAG: MOSC domain-containing protein [Campylobacterota bacterium]|nr:MOSC domain-containing protein [Campylobacterota bacterium]